ncbi:MAG: MraY family glycosyltransferase, partial [Syntrophobacterales bacterium]
MKRNNQLLLPAWYYFLALFLLGFAFFPATRFFFVHTGRRWLYILVLSFSFSALTTPFCRMFAMSWGLVDKPSGHKIHKEPTPLLGGAAVFLGFFLPLLINGIFSREFGAILLCAMTLFVLGLLDDTLNLKAHVKLIVQVVLAVGLTFVGVRIILVPETVVLGSIVNRLISVIWIVGITNAVNFFDGMDGLAAGLAAIISFFLAIVALQMDAPFVGWAALAMMGACLGFLPYNFRPGKRALIFLGD